MFDWNLLRSLKLTMKLCFKIRKQNKARALGPCDNARKKKTNFYDLINLLKATLEWSAGWYEFYATNKLLIFLPAA